MPRLHTWWYLKLISGRSRILARWRGLAATAGASRNALAMSTKLFHAWCTIRQVVASKVVLISGNKLLNFKQFECPQHLSSRFLSKEVQTLHPLIDLTAWGTIPSSLISRQSLGPKQCFAQPIRCTPTFLYRIAFQIWNSMRTAWTDQHCLHPGKGRFRTKQAVEPQQRRQDMNSSAMTLMKQADQLITREPPSSAVFILKGTPAVASQHHSSISKPWFQEFDTCCGLSAEMWPIYGGQGLSPLLLQSSKLGRSWVLHWDMRM